VHTNLPLARHRIPYVIDDKEPPETREIFANFKVETIAARYTVARAPLQEVSELIISGPRAD
jgi:hypothetical protein